MNIKQKAKKFIQGKEFHLFGNLSGNVNEWTQKREKDLIWFHEGTPFVKRNQDGTIIFYETTFFEKRKDGTIITYKKYYPEPIERRIKEIKKQIAENQNN